MNPPVPRFNFPRKDVSWCTRDALIFNLSIGVKPDNLELLHESNPNFQVFPTYSCVLGYKGTDQDVVDFATLRKPTDIKLPNVPRFDRPRVVDAEKRIIIHRPLPPFSNGRRFHLEESLSGLFDKGKVGTIVETTTKLVETSSNTLYTTTIGSVVARGQGGWGGPSGAREAMAQIPDRPPDYSIRQEIFQTTPLLYRLNGDYNPLHIDPQAAQRVGFARPIVHGLCTWNMVAYTLVQAVGTGQPRTLKEFQARFSAPVYPGDVLTIHIWCMVSCPPTRQDKEKEARFVAVNQDGKRVLSNGVAIFAPQKEFKL